MKFKFFLLIGLSFMFSKIFGQNKDAKANGLIGEVEMLVEKYYRPKINYGEIDIEELLLKRILHFHKNGKLKSQINILEYSSENVQYNYSLEGQLVSIYTINPDLMEIKDTMIYDKGDKIIKRITFQKDLNDDKIKKWKRTGVMIFNYDKNGNIIKIDHFYQSDNDQVPFLLHPYSNPENEYNMSNTTESHGVERIWKDFFSYGKNEYIVNMDHLNIQSYQLGRKNYITKFIYNNVFSFDEKNNWIKCVVYQSKEPELLITREIAYFKN